MSATPARYADLRDADEQTALHAVQTMPLSVLASLPRDIVRSWTGDPAQEGTARHARLERLFNDTNAATWRLTNIAAESGCGEYAVTYWRGRYLDNDPNWSRRLPAPDGAFGIIKQPGDADNPGGIPLWYPGTIRRWLYLTKRVDEDGYPHTLTGKRGGRTPPGRPPRQRTT